MKTKMMIYKRLPLRNLVHGFALVLLLFVQSLHTQVYCQCPTTTTEGTDFWVMILTNNNLNSSLQALYAVGNSNAVVTAEIPRANWSTTVNLTAGRYAIIYLPYALTMESTFNTVLDAGIHVTSTADISLYAENAVGHSVDFTQVLPTSSLRYQYMAQTYPPDSTMSLMDSNQIGVLAVEDSTLITISGLGTLNLMRGQVYQYSTSLSLSGVEVSSNRKPFAMFQGNSLMFVPHQIFAGDNLYEQAIPVDDWGQDFVIVPSALRVGNGEFVRITSSEDSCDITVDGVVVARNLLRGETYEFVIPYARAKRVFTSKPCYVCQYLSGESYGDTTGDPSSVTISPVDHGVCEASFVSINLTVTRNHFVNIVTETRYTTSMTLDGNTITPYFVVLDNTYSYARVPVSQGAHTLQNSVGTFVAHAYGLGFAESYAFTVGMKMRNIRENLLINDRVVNSDTVKICIYDTVEVKLNTNAMDTSVLWYIDGNRLNTNHLSFRHNFADGGYHRIMAITHGMCDTTWCDTLWTVVYVTVPYTDTISAVICEGDTFAFNGSYYTRTGKYIYITDTVNNCDTIILIDLTVLSRPRLQIFRTGNHCLEGRATLYVATNGNDITWTSTPYDTSLAGQEHNFIIYVSPQFPTEYTVTVDSVSRDKTCTRTASIVVSQPTPVHALMSMTPPKITLENLEMMFVDITVGDIVHRKWVFSEIPGTYGLTVYDDRVVYYTPYSESDSLSVSLAVTSSEGCTDTTTAVFPIIKSELWVPNAFVPDGDFNTVFQVGAYNLVEYEIYIYNRQGLLVYHSTDPAESWDGTKNGRPCIQESYVYVIDYKTQSNPNKSMKKVGSVLLIR